MEAMKRIVQRICISAFLLCLICMVSSCGESDPLFDQYSEYDSEPDESVSELVDPVQSTQESEIDKSSSKNTETIPEETTQEIAEEYTEILEDGRSKHTFNLFDDSKMFSVVVPPNWERGIDDAFSETFVGEYMTKESKRMEVCKLQGTTVEQWAEWYVDAEGPLNGVTAEGCEYIGYYRDPQIEKDVHWRVYYFLVVSEDGSLYSVSIYHNLDTDSENYLETVVIPAIESVIIE